MVFYAIKLISVGFHLFVANYSVVTFKIVWVGDLSISLKKKTSLRVGEQPPTVDANK